MADSAQRYQCARGVAESFGHPLAAARIHHGGGTDGYRSTRHFDFEYADDPVRRIDGRWLTDKLNRLLPPDISIYKTVPVVADAHARFDALSRTYHYYLHFGKSPFLRAYSCRLYRMIDFEKMNEAAAALFDYTDFTSFSKVNTDTKTNNCRIMQARWTELAPGEWRFEIQADRFLRNMVRAIVGTLVEVGRGKLTPEGFRAVIEGKDRCRAGESMPGNALFLVDVAYPDKCFMVENRNGKEKDICG